jgi:hypothetical protein
MDRLQYRELARAKIEETLNLMLTGQVSYIEGARIVNGWSHEAGFDRLSEPFVTFVAIDSETDAVPIGKVRDLWAADAVAKHLAEWESAEAWAQQCGEPACHKVLALLARH